MSVKNISEEICSQIFHLDDYKNYEKRVREKIEILALMSPIIITKKRNHYLNIILMLYVNSYKRNGITEATIREIIDIDFSRIVIYYARKQLNRYIPAVMSDIIINYVVEDTGETKSLHFP